MNKGKKLYEGKAKIIYETKEKGLAIQHFKDDATAFNNKKKATVEGKGVLNNRISEHILAFNWATKEELEIIEEMTFRVNDFMSGMFRGVGIKLVDFKLEFGRLWEKDKKEIILADEISPDTCRLWDVKSERKLDKDRFRKDLGNIIQAYQEVARRLGILPETTNISEVNFKKPTSINIKKK